MEYVSYEVAKKISLLGIRYGLEFNKYPTKCWRYPESSSGGHGWAPFIDDLNDYEDPYDIDSEVKITFNWQELFDLMNKIVRGDYRKAEMEAIDNIDQLALELYDYLEYLGGN